MAKSSIKEANTSPTIFLPVTGTQALAKEWLDWWGKGHKSNIPNTETQTRTNLTRLQRTSLNVYEPSHDSPIEDIIKEFIN
jgi:hypothetical protein